MFIKKIALAGLAFCSTFAMVPSAKADFISSPGRYDGGRLSIQTQRGTNCSSTAPDRASVGAAFGYENNDNYGYNYNNYNGADSSGLVGGVYVALPFGGPTLGDCNNILVMEEQRARLDMAVTLFEAGGMTADELKELAAEVKSFVTGSALAPKD